MQEMAEKNDFHGRWKSLRNLQNLIKKQKEYTPKNAEILLKYDAMMKKQFLKKKLVVSSWHKCLIEASAFTKFVEKDLDTLEKADVKKWFDYQEKRLMNGEITAWTIKKYFVQARKFIRFVFGIDDQKANLPIIDWARKELPGKTKNMVLAKDLPSQADIKRLLVNLRNIGNRTAIRDTAIIALCNDVGCRVSEALAITNDCISQEKNYLIITFPVSKTIPRSVISILAKPYIEEWGKISPNQDKGPAELFFCDKKGKELKYTALRNHLAIALEQTGIKFPKNKATHMFRKIFASRSYNWPTIIRNYWLGWSSGISDVYTSIDHRAAIPHYFKMLEEENNPMHEEKAFWENDQKDETIINLEKRLFQTESMVKELIQIQKPDYIQLNKRVDKILARQR